VGSGFLARSSLMLVGAAEGVMSEVIAWFAFLTRQPCAAFVGTFKKCVFTTSVFLKLEKISFPGGATIRMDVFFEPNTGTPRMRSKVFSILNTLKGPDRSQVIQSAMAGRCVILAAWALLLVGFAAAQMGTPKQFDFMKGFSDKAEDQALSVPSMTDLEFTWSGAHNVYLMKDKAAYDTCKFEGAKMLGDKSGTKHHIHGNNGDVFYFACQVSNHCAVGQKLAVTIVAAGGTTQTAGAMSVRVSAVFQCGCIRSPVPNVLPRALEKWRANAKSGHVVRAAMVDTAEYTSACVRTWMRVACIGNVAVESYDTHGLKLAEPFSLSPPPPPPFACVCVCVCLSLTLSLSLSLARARSLSLSLSVFVFVHTRTQLRLRSPVCDSHTHTHTHTHTRTHTHAYTHAHTQAMVPWISALLAAAFNLRALRV
jgi:hypothetical protein